MINGKEITSIIILCILLTLPLGKLIYENKDKTLGSDVVSFFISTNYIQKDAIKKGEIPLWNPYLFCGVPFIANPQTNFFYLSTLLIALAPNIWFGIRVSIFIHALIAGILMYILCRTLKYNHIISLICGLIFVLNGSYISRIAAGHITFVYGMTWIPLLYLGYIKKNGILCGLSLSLMFLSGGLIICIYSMLILIINTVILIISKRDFNFEFLSICLVIFLGLSSVKLIPFLESINYITRKNFLNYTESSKIHIHNIRELFIVLFSKKSETIKNVSGPFVYEHLYYINFLVAIFSLFGIKKKKEFLILCIICVLISFANSFPVDINFLIYHIPLFNTLQIPIRWLIFFDFFLILLFGEGLYKFKNLAPLVLLFLYITQIDLPYRYINMQKFDNTHIAAKFLSYPIELNKNQTAIVTIKNIGNIVWRNKSTSLFINYLNKEMVIPLNNVEPDDIIKVQYKINCDHCQVKYNIIYNKTFLMHSHLRLTNVSTKIKNLKLSNKSIILSKNILDYIEPSKNYRIFYYPRSLISNYEIVSKKYLSATGIDPVEQLTTYVNYLSSIHYNPYKFEWEIKLENSSETMRRLGVKYLILSGEEINNKLKKEYKFISTNAGIILENKQFKGIVETNNPYTKALIKSYSYNRYIIQIINATNESFLKINMIYYPGWSYIINNKKYTLNKNMTIQLEEGNYNLQLIFDPISFKLGVIITLITIFYIVLRFVWLRRSMIA